MRGVARRLIEAEQPGLIFMVSLDFLSPWHDKAVSRASAMLGQRLSPHHDSGKPHVTVLYMGRGHTPSEVEHAKQKTASVAEPWFSRVACVPRKLACFDPGPSSAGLIPVVLELDSDAGLGGLHTSLLRQLASVVKQDQFHDYRAHLTLGYASTMPNKAELAMANASMPVMVPFRVRQLDLLWGSTVVRRCDL